jgi:hypothetical protein
MIKYLANKYSPKEMKEYALFYEVPYVLLKQQMNF